MNASGRPQPLRAKSAFLVNEHENRLDDELVQLVKDIKRIGPTYPDPAPHVLFGELFDDEEVEQYYEALVGTLKSAKKRGLITFKGQMLLKGMHDNVKISIVGEEEEEKGKTSEQVTSIDGDNLSPLAKERVGNSNPPRGPKRSQSLDPSTLSKPLLKTETVASSARKDLFSPPKLNDLPTSNGTIQVETPKVEQKVEVVKSKAFTFSPSTTASKKMQRKAETSRNTNVSPIPSHKKSGKPPKAPQYRSLPPFVGQRTNDGDSDTEEEVSRRRSRLLVETSTNALSDSEAVVSPRSLARRKTSSLMIQNKEVPLWIKMRRNLRRVNSDGSFEAKNHLENSCISDDVAAEDKENTNKEQVTASGEETKKSLVVTPTDVSKTPKATRVEACDKTPVAPQSIQKPPHSAPPIVRARSEKIVPSSEIRVDEEIEQLLKDIRRVGSNPGEPSVTFGELFDDDIVQNTYEALVGTLRSAKRKGVITFKGQMLLKGMHDNVMIEIVGK